MENMDKGLTVPKWVLIVWSKIQVKKITNPETPQNQLFISNCFELPSDWLSQ